MSRHRFLKNIDLEDELDDDALSDGGEEDMGPEHQEQLDMAFAEARSVLGSEETSGLSDMQIRNAVWDFYFDVEKSVDWLLEQQSKARATKERKDNAVVLSSQQPLSALQRLSLAQNAQSTKLSLVSLARTSNQTPSNSSKLMMMDGPAKTPGISKLSLLSQSKASQGSMSSSSQSSIRPNSTNVKPNPTVQSKLALKTLKIRETSLQQPVSFENELHPLTAQEKYSQPPAPDLLGLPSPFALTLSSSTNLLTNSHKTFTLPPNAFTFETPSPDDLVLQARQKMTLPTRLRRS